MGKQAGTARSPAGQPAQEAQPANLPPWIGFGWQFLEPMFDITGSPPDPPATENDW